MKKKVIIFTCSAGGGHTSVSSAIHSYFNEDVTVKEVNTFYEVLGSIDPIQILTFNTFTLEQFYNFCMKRKWNWVINFIYKIGKWYFRITHKKNQELIKKFLEKEKPNLIISVIPLVNNDILEVTQNLDIPFILTPTDLDASSFIPGLKNPTYNKFRFTVAFNDEQLLSTLIPADIPKKLLTTTGFPLRCSFFSKKNKDEIKKEFKTPGDKPTLLLLMGAIGINEIIPFLRQLIKVMIPIHILICIGKNEKLRKKINQLSFPPHISFTIIGFTEKISDLMSITDLLITKSGTVSFCEGIYMNVPMLIDSTSHVVAWEQFNHEFLLKHGFGDVIKKRSNIPFIIQNLLTNPSVLKRMKDNLQKFSKKNGCEEIKKLANYFLQQ